MATTLEEARKVVMELSDADRAALVEELVAGSPADEVWRREWAEEAERRYQELSSGSVPALTREEFFRDED
jgi:putative addiction module component (TIGR02574 family)